MLKSAWHDVGSTEYLAPNAIAEAAREMGSGGEEVWLGLARAGMLEGRKTGQWEIAAEVGAKAAGLDQAQLLARAKSPDVEARMRESTAEFHAMKVNQRPTFVVDSTIGDRAVFAGFAKVTPLAATIDAMLDDLAFYDAHSAHFGAPPP
jgi:predicted DsbA family dithiol-disulfide isomerase